METLISESSDILVVFSQHSGIGIMLTGIATTLAILGLAYKVYRNIDGKRLKLEVDMLWMEDEREMPSDYFLRLHIANKSAFPVTIQSIGFEPRREGMVLRPREFDLGDVLPLRLDSRHGHTSDIPTTRERDSMLSQDIVYNRRRTIIIMTTANEEIKRKVEVKPGAIVGESGFYRDLMELAKQVED